MAKNAHLTFDERQTIEVSLRDNLKFKEIGEILGKDPSTISKEVRNHYKVVEKSTYNPCANRRTCKHYGDICKPCKKRWGQDCKKCDPPCYTHCPDFEEQVCLKIKKPPYVCNGCDTRQGCKLSRHLYEAKYAQNEYEAVRSESRQGFAISMGFSLLRALEFFVFRKMEMPETKTHLLCGWSQIVIQKNHLSVTIELFRHYCKKGKVILWQKRITI